MSKVINLYALKIGYAIWRLRIYPYNNEEPSARLMLAKVVG